MLSTPLKRLQSLHSHLGLRSQFVARTLLSTGAGMRAASTSASTSAWTQPLSLGDALTLPNRVLCAPCTRNRAHVPGDLQAEYYAQRAGAGLIISEATLPVPQGYEFPNAPGIYEEEQVAGWRKVTEAVHAKGGRIFLQVMNIGRVAHPVLQSGQPCYGPSAVAAEGGNFRHLGETVWVDPAGNLRQIKSSPPYTEPVAVTDPWARVAEYKRAFENAKRAGFDGVEVHGANGYLIAQFFDSKSNTRTDEWGGSAQKRTKFALEVVKAALEVWGPHRVGIKLSPEGGYNDMGMKTQETLDTYGGFLRSLSELPTPLAYVHVQRWFAMFDPKKRGTIVPEKTWRELWKGKLFLNGNFTPEEGAKFISEGVCDAILFGRDFISTPDLPRRCIEGLPPNSYMSDKSAFYVPQGRKNYTDFKRWDEMDDKEKKETQAAFDKLTAEHAKEAKKKEEIYKKQVQEEQEEKKKWG